MYEFVEHRSEKDMSRIPSSPQMGVISITDFWRRDEAQLQPGWGAVLRLKFDDTEDPPGTYKGDRDVPFDESDAKKIIDFVRDHENDLVGIYVHCHAGVSRSAAVAKWIAEKYGIPFDQSYDKYNTLVYDMLKRYDSPSPEVIIHEGAFYKRVTAAGPEQELEKLLQAVLPGTNFAGKAFAVGGYVRDAIMGIDSKDLDAVVSFEGGAKDLTTFLHNQFPGSTTRPHNLGAGYPIWKIVFNGDTQFNGVSYKTDGAEFEVADTQKEAFPDPESRQRVTEPGTLSEDVERRDFTVNMLMKDLSTGRIVDLAGTSVEDIERGILRGHPKVPMDKTFQDDPLRMMRLIRFMAKYDFDADPEAVEAVKRNAERIEIISSERVRDELIKIMDLGKLDQAIRFMDETGLLPYILPEVQELKGVEQPPEWHSEGDVFEHTMLVLNKAKPGVLCQLAALLHDVGKPAAMQVDEETCHISFKGHEKESAAMAEDILRRLKFDNKTIDHIKNVVRYHMRPHFLDRGGKKAMRKFLRDIGDHLDDVMDLAEADALSALGPSGEPAKPMRYDELRKELEEVQQIPVRKKPVLTGYEVMEILGVPPGPEIGKANKWLMEKMDELAAEGIELTTEEAKRLLLEEYVV